MRQPIVGAVDKRGHALIRTQVAIVTIALLLTAYRAVPAGPPPRPDGTVPQVVVTVVMLLATVSLAR